MPVITAKQLVGVILRLGFRLDRQKGSHAIYVRDLDRSRIVIPLHAGKDIKPKTLAGILNDIGIGIDEFRDHL